MKMVYPIKPRFVLGKLPSNGKMVDILAAGTPNHVASVAAACTDDVVGIHRPFSPESSGPPETWVGNVP